MMLTRNQNSVRGIRNTTVRCIHMDMSITILDVMDRYICASTHGS